MTFLFYFVSLFFSIFDSFALFICLFFSLFVIFLFPPFYICNFSFIFFDRLFACSFLSSFCSHTLIFSKHFIHHVQMQVTTQAAQQKTTTSDSTYSTVNLTFPLLSIFGEVRTDLSKPAFSEGSRVVLIKFRCQCAKSPGKFFRRQ